MLVAAVALTMVLAWVMHRLVEAPAMRLAARIRWWHGDREGTAPGA